MNQLVASINWKLMFTIIQGAIAFFLVLWIKNFLVALVAWLRFKNSLYMCLGTWVRIPTSDSYVDGQIQSANIRFIEIVTKETRIYIPTKSFPDRDWVLLKKDALLSHKDEMHQLGSVETSLDKISPKPE